ncbi:hypothetical protein LINPERPRIM_LOCUS41124, partial [Linum perenne]
MTGSNWEIKLQFFSLTMLKKNATNTIRQLKTTEGEMVDDIPGISKEVAEFYEMIFGESNEANYSAIQVVADAMEEFRQLSGLQFNPDKCQIIFARVNE